MICLAGYCHRLELVFQLPFPARANGANTAPNVAQGCVSLVCLCTILRASSPIVHVLSKMAAPDGTNPTNKVTPSKAT